MSEDFSKYNGDGTVLRKAQLRMLDILVEVDKICRKHNITYWLAFGSVLGAVRHGGFIPWDDDLDIGVMHKDYKRLCEILKHELPDNFVFQDKTTDKYYPLAFAKVRDTKSVLKDPIMNPKIKEKGIYIDIFPYENGNIKVKRIVDFFYINIFMRIRHHIKAGKVTRFIAYMGYPLLLLSVAVIRGLYKIVPSNHVILSYGCPYFHAVKKNDLFPIKLMKFEGKSFFVPSNTDGYLSSYYGDYMQIPSPEKREIHSTDIFLED